MAKVVLLGYMASGKSTVGKLLANKLQYDFMDLDEVISQREKMTIPEVFSEKGEIYFRRKETEVLHDVLTNDSKMVLALGGGTPCYGNNMQLIHQNTDISIYLKLSIGALIQRISKEKQQRPLVADIPDTELPEFVGKHLFERSPFYSLAHYTLATDGKALGEVVAEIENLLV